MPASDRTRAIQGLDGLRALAALAVFGVHFNQIVRLELQFGPFDLARLLANGEHGVALFFLLSGFLLGMPFWHALDSGQGLPGFKAYAVRRLARILPAYYVALTLLILIYGLWRLPAAYADIALHYLFLFNLAEFSIFSINAPFWTLAVEMQFYLLLPLLFLLLTRTPEKWRLPLLLFIGLAAYLAHYRLMAGVRQIVDWPFDPLLVWIRPYGAVVSHSLLAHLPHFLLGVLSGRLFLSANGAAATARRQGVNELIFWSALGAILLLLATPLEDLVQIPYGRYGLPLLPLLLALLLFSAPASRHARRALQGFPLRQLGVISYGVYIYHLPCLLLLDRYLAVRGVDAAQHWLPFGLAGFAVTLAVAGISFLVVERPVIRWVRRRG